MKTFMFDSNIFDKIIVDEALKNTILKLKNNGQTRILTTHIQQDELNATPNPEKRKKLIECSNEICEFVNTMGIVAGVSKVGMCIVTGIGEIEKSREGKAKHTKDALISVTAGYDADFFVTNDRPLRNRINRNSPNIKVIDFEEFVNKIEKGD